MNKIQTIELLKLRGVVDLNGSSIGKAIKDSGGDPSLEEMVKVSENAMIYFIDKRDESEGKLKDALVDNLKLHKAMEASEEDLSFLECLRAAGVDNWEGYSVAQDMMKEGGE